MTEKYFILRIINNFLRQDAFCWADNILKRNGLVKNGQVFEN